MFKDKIKSSLFRLNSKNLNIPQLVTKEYAIQEEEIEYFSLSSNLIYIIQIDGKKCYFRECCCHTDFNNYIEDKISIFCEIAQKEICRDNFKLNIPIQTVWRDNDIEMFRSWLMACKHNGLYSKLKDINTILRKEKFSLWEDRYKITTSIMNNLNYVDYEERLSDLVSYFTLFLRGVVYQYQLNSFCKRGNYECYNASKSLCSYIIADFLGLEELVSEAVLVKLNIRNRGYKYGVISPAADGTRAQDSSFSATPSLQRCLSNLNILDVICYQKDHGTNNYNILPYNGIATSICAFDNDNEMTFFPNPLPSFMSYSHTSPFVQNGYINRPYLDREIAETIMSLNVQSLCDYVTPYLNKLQILALNKRVKRLQKAIMKTMNNNPSFLLEMGDWNHGTIAEEMSGKYGLTYLGLYNLRK